MKASLTTTVFAILTLWLSGCDYWQQPERRLFEKYNQRLANVLEVAPTTTTESPPITIPDKRSLFHELPRLSLGLLESYQLRECGLFHLLAEKNSSLGKVQDAFYNLDYQTSLLRTLNTCLNDFPLNDQENTKLEQLYKLKWQHLLVHLDNVFLASDVMRKQLTSARWLSTQSKNQIAPIKDAFFMFDEFYQAPYKVISRLPDTPVTLYQESLEKSRTIGSLYYSLLNAAEWLKQITQMLEQNQANIICNANRDTTQFRYLRNVFQNVYIDEVQPYMAFLDSTYQQLSVGIDLINNRMAAHGEHYGIKNAHDAFRRNTIAHVEFWKDLFKRCGTNVGRN